MWAAPVVYLHEEEANEEEEVVEGEGKKIEAD